MTKTTIEESKHTQGPWIQNVDTVWRGGWEIVCHPLNSKQSIADARLIAAAPELLEALEEITELCYELAMKSPVLAPSVDRIIPAARAAIAKSKA